MKSRSISVIVMTIALIFYGCANPTAPTENVPTENVPTENVPTENAPLVITVSKQTANIITDTFSETVLTVTTSGVPDGTVGVIKWYSDKDCANAIDIPDGLMTTIDAISKNSATIRINSSKPTRVGTYYFIASFNGNVSSANSIIIAKPVNVYAGGSYKRSTYYDAAGYWLNGKWVNLPNGCGASFAAGVETLSLSNYVLYAAGRCCSDSTSNPQVASYWVDGTWHGVPTASYTFFRNSAINGSDVYIAGEDETAIVVDGYITYKSIAKYWKNGVPFSLSNPYGAYNSSSCMAICIAGTDVYAAGSCSDGKKGTAGYWKNGSWTAFVNPYGEDYSPYPRSIIIDNSDIYITGNFTKYGLDTCSSYAGYWKNGKWNELVKPYGNDYESICRNIAISDGDIYVTGYVCDASEQYGGYWKNGEWHGIKGCYSAYMIQKYGCEIYVAGDQSDRDAGYWKNDEWIELSAPSSALSAEVRAILVLPLAD